MVNKKLETRKNIIEYCKENGINERDRFYLLHAFHVDTTEDFQNMINYIKQYGPNAPVTELKDEPSKTKIFIFKPRDNKPKKD